MYDEINDNSVLRSSYTWSDMYILPYESRWSIKLKFCFLNAESWSWFDHRKNIINYKDNESKKISYTSFDATRKKDLYEGNTTKMRYCPKCMKYGFHSNIHQSLLLIHCFIHPDTEIIEISDNELMSSKFGTYEFIDIKTENLIHNEVLHTKISNYIKQRVEVMRMWTFYHNNKDESLYKSFIEIVERYYFQIPIRERYYSKKLLEIKTDNISEINNIIYTDIINSLAYDNYVRNGYHTIEEYAEYVKLSIELPDKTHIFRFNGLSSAYYMESLASNKVWTNFNDRRDFAHTARLLNNVEAFQNDGDKCKVSKIATYMTIACMIDCNDAYDYCRLNGRWRNFRNSCEYATALTTDLSGHTFFNYASDSYLENGILFLAKTIFDDFFDFVSRDLIKQINKIKWDYKENLSNISINEPAYVVIRYPGSWSVFGCYPE